MVRVGRWRVWLKVCETRVREVRTRDDLGAFLRLAAEDLAANPEGWENDSLPAFIPAWAAWLNSCPGWFERNGEEVPRAAELESHRGYGDCSHERVDQRN